jgi:acyl-[acyl-carrier-protein]-phospholipid O-acyltransferase / long-chain-fatty-acid--[acyl-carrier-protein] ligase
MECIKYLVKLFFRVALLTPMRLHYRVQTIGAGNIPREGGVLLLSNHVSYIDAFIIYLSCPRPVRFVVLETYEKLPSIGWFVRLFGGIPITPTKAKEALLRTAAALREGGVVCLFPEGGLTRLGVTEEFKKGFEIIARQAKCPVVPVYMDGLWKSIFSFERDRYFKKWPHGLTCPLQVAYGTPIDPLEATAERVRLAVWETSVVAFSKRRELKQPLETALVRSLKRHPRKACLIEHGKNGRRVWTRSEVLGLSLAMARRWMRRPPGPGIRVGVLLPSGPLTTILQLGLVFAGRIPLHLPLNLEQDPEEHATKLTALLKQYEIQTVISSSVLLSRWGRLGLSNDAALLDFASILSELGSGLVSAEKLRALWEPSWLTVWRLSFGERDREREAVGIIPTAAGPALFLTGSELLRNAAQIRAADFVRKDDVVFTEEPLSDAPGLQFGSYLPLLGGLTLVSRSLSHRERDDLLVEILLREQVTLLVGSWAFYQSIDGTLPETNLRYGIVFGEIATQALADREQALGLPLARGGSFEARIVTLSRTDAASPADRVHQPQRGRDPESIGRPLPGIAIRLENGMLQWGLSPNADPGSPSPVNWFSTAELKGTLTPEGFVLVDAKHPD